MPSSESTVRQQVRSFMAAPVVFRGELLAVCYVDRLDRSGPFAPEAQAVFHAIAYELARPLLTLLEQRRRQEYERLRDELLEGVERGPALVSSPAFERVLQQARNLAPHRDANLLLLGETGVGKEVVARFIHDLSGEPVRPFVAVNLGAVPAELFESELMGSSRGAFTGAEDRPGRILEAEGGTLFLDEVADLRPENQGKLLRFLQDKRVTPVGGRGERAVDVRVIAATNRPISALVARGEFRADLLHRFAPPLVVPPLRERRGEILPHARAYLARKARERGLSRPDLSANACRLLETHGWPGNVRQLEAVLGHALVLGRGGRIDRALLEPLVGLDGTSAGGGASGSSWTDWQAECQARERVLIEDALAQAGGSMDAAARRIGCPGTTFRRLVVKYGLRPPTPH